MPAAYCSVWCGDVGCSGCVRASTCKMTDDSRNSNLAQLASDARFHDSVIIIMCSHTTATALLEMRHSRKYQTIVLQYSKSCDTDIPRYFSTLSVRNKLPCRRDDLLYGNITYRTGWAKIVKPTQFLLVSFNKKDGYRQLNVRQLGSLRPWDHRSKCYTDRKRIQCLLNASRHVPIYLQPFPSNSSRKIQRSPF